MFYTLLGRIPHLVMFFKRVEGRKKESLQMELRLRSVRTCRDEQRYV